MANQFAANQGVLHPDTYVDLLSRDFDNIWSRRDRFAGTLSQFFTEVNLESGDSYAVSSVSDIIGLPRENEDEAALPYAQPAPGFDKNFTMVERRLGIRVTRRMVQADRWGKINGMMTGLTKAAMRCLEYQRAAIFDNAFASGTGADSCYLCYDSHPHENPEAGTWDNLSTGAMTGANLQAMVLLAAKQKNEMGFPDAVTIKTILGPPDLRQKFLELTGSVLRAEDSLNAKTVIISDLNWVSSPFLSSTTAFFGIGDLEGEEKGLLEIYREKPNVKPNSPANVDILMDQRVRMVSAIGFTTSKNVYGSTGT